MGVVGLKHHFMEGGAILVACGGFGVLRPKQML